MPWLEYLYTTEIHVTKFKEQADLFILDMNCDLKCDWIIISYLIHRENYDLMQSYRIRDRLWIGLHYIVWPEADQRAM